MIKAVLFDMDGVLLDTERLGLSLLPQISQRQGYPMSGEIYKRLLGVNNQLSKKILTELYGADYPYEFISEEHKRTFLEIALRGEMPVKPGVAECMSGLCARGLKRALVTSTERSVVEIYIEHIPEMQGVFDVMVCGAEAGRSKPEPDIYLEAARQLGLAPADCVGVEDSLNGLKSIKAAGCVGVMAPDLLPYGEPFYGLADYVISDLTKLCPLLDRIGLGARVRA